MRAWWIAVLYCVLLGAAPAFAQSRTVTLPNNVTRDRTLAGEDFRHERVIENIHEAVRLEIAYAADCLPTGVMGLNVDLFDEYVKYIANRRLERIGLPQQYRGARNPFPWMSETIDLGKEKNFFESRVTEYRSGSSLSWD